MHFSSNFSPPVQKTVLLQSKPLAPPTADTTATSMIGHATEAILMIGHATEQPAADRAATRYLVTIYSLNPARRLDAHTVVCIMLHKGLLRDDGLRAFIEQHIDTAIAPDLTLSSDELMETMNFVIPTPTQPKPALLEQLRDYCSRSQATRFQEPLLDGAGYTIALLSLKPDQWQHVRDVTTMLGEAVLRELGACADQ